MQPLRRQLLAWYRKFRRDLPWRATRDPYRILLSEIMLQQTRVETVLPYYDAFLTRFPDVTRLADAPEAEVLTLWSGLGYYSRARNLLRAARQISEAGAFPRDYSALRELPGVGDYTAAAVASIAFDLPFAAVDGNVLRVVARVFNDEGDIGSAVTRRRFQQMAQEMLDAGHPGEFNQAVMELGATVCLPRNPRCAACPIRTSCGAHGAGRAAELPIKLKRQESRSESISVAVVARDGLVLMRQRPADASRMAGFWELPNTGDLPALQGVRQHGAFRHTIVNTVFEVQVCTGTLRRLPAGTRWTDVSHHGTPVTTISRKAIELVATRRQGV
ncbi:MAG TPA: A/G-specific adenine glycosylase [Bryobacteraceae bacterium]